MTILLGSTVEVYMNDVKEFTGLFFRDNIMKIIYPAYLELIIADATYKMKVPQMPLYLILIVDNIDQSEIVGLYLTLETIWYSDLKFHKINSFFEQSCKINSL